MILSFLSLSRLYLYTSLLTSHQYLLRMKYVYTQQLGAIVPIPQSDIPISVEVVGVNPKEMEKMPIAEIKAMPVNPMQPVQPMQQGNGPKRSSIYTLYVPCSSLRVYPH